MKKINYFDSLQRIPISDFIYDKRTVKETFGSINELT